jgi:hypothetical protein
VLALLLATVIGIPLALLFGLIWLVIVLLSGVFAAYLLGELILRGRTNPIWTMLLGAAILILLSFVPFLDILVSLLSLWFGLGTILQQVPRLRTMNGGARGTRTAASASQG